MARIVLHAGFHKTGTSTAQAFLDENAQRLPKGWRYLPHPDPAYAALRRLCRGRGGAGRLSEIEQAMAALIAAQQLGPDDVLILSTEDFAGPIPDKASAHPLYHCAPALARALVRACAGHQVTLIYTTRARASWLRSWHGHLMMWRDEVPPLEDLLRSPRVAGFSFETTLEAIRAAADAPVIDLALEDHAAERLGGAILAAAGLPEADRVKLHPVSLKNRGAPEWLQRAAQTVLPRLVPRRYRSAVKKRLLRLGNALRR